MNKYLFIFRGVRKVPIMIDGEHPTWRMAAEHSMNLLREDCSSGYNVCEIWNAETLTYICETTVNKLLRKEGM